MKTYNEIKHRICDLDEEIKKNYYDTMYATRCRNEIEVLRWVLGEIP